MTDQELDTKRFMEDAEECCFDCGASDKQLTKIGAGVTLCPDCLRVAKEDYPNIVPTKEGERP